MARVFLIDTDTASDDAIALIMALREPDVCVVAITTVAGNVEVQQATRNALYTVELCDADVPVYAGAERPLIRTPQDSTWFHGRDGLGDHNYPPPRRSAERAHAVDAICATVATNPGLVLVALGPLTNIALALALRPEIAHTVGRCVIMGGAFLGEGNVTPVAEYNIWADPDAARIVLHSGLPIELIGLHLCSGDALLNTNDIALVSSFSSKLAHFAIECTSRSRQAHRERTGEDGISLPDPIAMAVAIDPLVRTRAGDYLVEVETSSELTRGVTAVDRWKVAGNSQNRSIWSMLLRKGPNANVCWTIDVARWREMLYRALR